MNIIHELDDQQTMRYARHLIMDDFGEDAQLRLLNARVLVVGVGGLGSVCASYLGAAGIGTLGLIDHDTVELSNLHRQILYENDDTGRLKATCAAQKINYINPEITLQTHILRLDADNAKELVGDYDYIVDGLDNYESRRLLNQACIAHQKPLISAAVIGFEGQMHTHLPGGACYNCLFPTPPAQHLSRCEQVGIIGPMVGLIGSLQALETIKLITNHVDIMHNQLLLVDARSFAMHRINAKRNKNCADCGHLS